MSEEERSAAHFAAGYNCAQAVLLACTERAGPGPETAARLAAAFGGGMAGTGDACGAVTGALMAIGWRLGGSSAGDRAARDRVCAAGQELMARFTGEHGSVRCRDLLGCDLSTPEGRRQAQERGLHRSLCPALVRSATRLVDEVAPPSSGGEIR